LRHILLLLLLGFVTQSFAQNKIGVRAGFNYSDFVGGEAELGEELGYNSGFHFGVNYTYQFNPRFGPRGELAYIQRGASLSFSDPNVYNFIKTIGSANSIIEYGKKEINLEFANGYISIPITAQLTLSEKWEVFGGLSLDLLVNPSGRGSLDFQSASRPQEIFYIVSYDHRYRSHEAGEVPFLNSRSFVSILLDGTSENLFRTESAYYHLTEDQVRGKKFGLFDTHVLFGVNYFLNSGFYVGVRAELGLFDLTNDKMDFSLRDLDTDNNYILRQDNDKSRSVALSIGFRF